VDKGGPYWQNGWLSPLDAAILYGQVVQGNPRLYIEVGSGNSTKFVRQAIRDHGLRTELISIDPRPRAEIDGLCDQVIRRPFQDVAPAALSELRSGDILFVDSSHRVLMNSDVTAIFLDVLPQLPPGVRVHFHDIWLPFDYPQRWRYWYFSEQYLLASTLLLAPHRLQVRMPCMYVSAHPHLSAVAGHLWDFIDDDARCRHGGSFWIDTRLPSARDASEQRGAICCRAEAGSAPGA
jgi:hypothetical protein